MESTVEYGFVVLHYMAYDMTLKCAESLLALPVPVRLVIVDNASPDGSGELLRDRFAASPSVTVILNESNEGFARGNNAGYKYLRDHFQCRFITVLNNDVLIKDRGFTAKVEDIYGESPFAVLGPDILNPGTGVHQNPVRLEAFSVQEVLSIMDRFGRSLRHYRWKQFKWRVKRFFLPGIEKKAPPVYHDSPMKGVVLHGACYVFSEDFIRSRESCFNPATFLYFEEYILHLECLRDGLVMLYNPSVQVLHLEDVSTDAAFRHPAAKEMMKLRESLRSLEVLLTLTKS